jgi:hypothetical protein
LYRVHKALILIWVYQTKKEEEELVAELILYKKKDLMPFAE